ncbi:ribokinase [Gracilibacillus boraciitolerans JCM 21714]|uniref:Ribokinase n=1 Tax=Gracilibacillus boraciitolerans JCM 21714 TaxID=1298598 RepID=W4VG55_9BACI|nr:ribokinase [Gracilibacillus boraciitolerans JCM 21714]
MIGRVGDDSFGSTLLENFEKEYVNTDHIDRVENTPSGLANIILSEKDNRIIIISGANAHVTPSYIERSKSVIIDSDYVLLQFEIPRETIEYCLQICSEHGIPVIVNPAPAMNLSEKSWEQATFITPNATERKQLFDEEWKEKLIVTRGKEGVSFIENGKEKLIPSHSVDVVDTTGAGDTFNGAFAVALARGLPIEAAVRFANAAAALSVGQLGAQGGMPAKEQVEEILAKG